VYILLFMMSSINIILRCLFGSPKRKAFGLLGLNVLTRLGEDIRILYLSSDQDGLLK
jgi:hypothetical protein